MERACYQFGNLTRKKRAKGPDTWEFRFYEPTEHGERRRKSCIVGNVAQYPTKAQAQKAVEALLLKLNSETPQQRLAVVTFGAICDRYLKEEMPERYSTSKSYQSNIKNHLKPRWGDYLLDRIRPMAVEDWLKKLPMAPKSKTHIRSVMHLMYECATRWELFTDKRNPIALVRIKDGSKRRQRPAIVTVDQFKAIIALLKEPYRTMAYIAQCLGLRVSEIAALQWDDFDFEKNQLLVQRSIVNGNVDDVKTEYSQDYVPLHPSLTEVILEWSKEAVPTKEGWLFANPITEQPYFPTEIQRRHLRPAGWCLVECPKCGVGTGVWCRQDRPTPNGGRLPIHKERRAAAGKYSSIGWHTFRHTYRSWLDETGAPMKVQQELMRHASIQTTMNVYGQAMSSSKREANGKVVEMVLKASA
ncbi:site-specific integrase [Granulicella sp. dw_53]|uniref:tyrosine-type recombinase/integrase n=1 Tax=Granulicella sp. dw_53 TaxID=2719792 RepID=UPI001BD3FE85|nr:site-specific integrase [Granulicella sp. dw_53]